MDLNPDYMIFRNCIAYENHNGFLLPLAKQKRSLNSLGVFLLGAAYGVWVTIALSLWLGWLSP